MLGLKPVLADVDEDTFLLSPKSIEKLITSRTKAIVPVHLFGQCCDMEQIMKLANKYELFVIEDSAQAMGADFQYNDGTLQKAGTIGDIGCTSFFPSKNLGCFGDGGALFTNNDELALMIRSIANHGMKVRYYHDHIGINSRLDTIQAAILNVKLKNLEHYNTARQKAADYYDRAFQNEQKIKIPLRVSYSNHIFHQYTVIIKDADRDGLKNFLQSKGIPAMVYYPVTMHLQHAYQYLGYRQGDFPVSEFLCKSVLSLPMHTELDNQQLEYITSTITEFLSK